MTSLSRRQFLGASAGLCAGLISPLPLRAAQPGMTLRAETRTLDIGGRAATVMGLRNGAGGQGLTLDPGQRFQVALTNGLSENTIVHWHGQIPPNDQDGAPNTNPMLTPGETRAYDFAPRPGTFWMHSHVPQQEIALLAAPLIVRRPEDLTRDRQEVTMFLHDFAFAPPEAVLAALQAPEGDHAGSGGGMSGEMSGGMRGGMAMDHGTMKMAPSGSGGMGSGMGMASGMGSGAMAMGQGMTMDLNDYEFDAYLANDRTLDDPEVVAVERGGRVLLRIVNASSMTAYWIDTGSEQARLVAVDGDPVQPVTGRRFPLAQAQRLEIELDLPKDGAALPVLALREGSRAQTGLVLAPPGARVAKLPLEAAQAAAPVANDMRLEAALRAQVPLPDRAVTRRIMVMLNGTMQPYRWTINNQVWDDHQPILASHGDRVELTFHNMSMMAHPMHLHGHVFQVVALGSQRLRGALRDTVLVPAMSTVTVALDAGQAARWMMHCHHMGHLANGMMTELSVLPTA
ncbi:multicopper oxidase domain-containing protein [Pseudooceanicola sp. CBS1P-1]|uniref:Multicopper oxidase domain-containing protein n=1 Tax=Pseudooceanicola albus TaxID=2692189 RepID=A0A6L7GBF3_9RHOB|nr:MULTISPECIES: multicopper oxidase domain-containing protein [Pseudooceanicola]MBT9384423.1 multicopper oxidase domain-containing protein [Pseudooceanicola endophyticus]MXN20676.1 multicopper oxidase domain-containing protein [Pseudooceanicola albus]